MRRRDALKLGAAGALLPAVGPARALAATVDLSGPYVDLNTPEGNVLAYARVQGSIDPDVTSYSWYKGRVAGVRPGEAAQDLMTIIGMGAVRMMPLDGEYGFQMLRKELGFFTDIETGEVIDSWLNPYLDEEVEVVHIANPAINAAIVPYKRRQGLYQEVEESDLEPFMLPWQRVGDRVLMEQHTHLWAKNPMDPDIWKRESAGAEIAISDSMTFNVALADLQNRDLEKVPSFGNWTHKRPWQPWMLMGQDPGFIQYTCFTGSAASLDDLPSQIVELARDRFPEFLEAPTEVKPPESSLARYMRTREPAHLRAAN